MTTEQKQKLIDMLVEIHETVNKLPSIEEKRSKYLSYLETVSNLGLLPFEIDVDSEEINELITNNFLNIEIVEPTVFVAEGYQPWLENARPNIQWDYKNRYFKYLLKKKHWIPQTVFNLDKMSDIIIDHTANPKTDKYFNVRGLVMGDIQSGKTANYTALVNKAIDAGYKIIIILAGLTRELRNQTQTRLDNEVAGKETSKTHAGKITGVGEFGKPSISVETLTYADDEKGYGDFKDFFAHHVLNESLNPVIAVVKKNSSVLKHLYDFLSKSDEDCYANGKLRIPVMIIDDEVDQASVDTKNSSTIENASAINKWIRKILDKLNRCSYVGYTATPFANVFIDPDKESDLYPKDFILYMPPSKGYCGIQEYFGVDVEDDDDESIDHSTDLYREIKKEEFITLFGKIKDKVKVDTDSVNLPESLKTAIIDFIISCSIKKARGFDSHNSMLIHIARFKNPSTTLKPLVVSYIAELLLELTYNFDEAKKIYQSRWENNFKEVTKKRTNGLTKDKWNKIEQFLLPTLESIKMDRIKVLNGDSEDSLDYSTQERGDFIVIGGDKLSRGLTLEGLSVSYYWRKTKQYDSLLQMARWFGYRTGWIDVCRIYTSYQFLQDFINVGKVVERFKNDLTKNFNDKMNPREVGQRIMYSANLLPTSRSKMKAATKLKVSFSNEIQQIISFDRKLIPSNFEMTKDFINKLGEPTYLSDTGKLVYKDVPVETVLDYLKAYKECGSFYEYGQININNWVNYIENLVNKGELNNWTIVISSLKDAKSSGVPVIGGKYVIYKRDRRLRNIGDPQYMDHYTVKVITDPSDFKEALEKGTQEYIETNMFDKKKTYEGFNENNGLLSLYIFDLHERIPTGKINEKTGKEITLSKEEPIDDAVNVCAPAIWFSKTKDYESSAVAYYVTKDYMDRNDPTKEEDEDYDD